MTVFSSIQQKGMALRMCSFKGVFFSLPFSLLFFPSLLFSFWEGCLAKGVPRGSLHAIPRAAKVIVI